MKKIIYLDNNATTQIAPEVLKAIINDNLPYNPSSFHTYGRKAKNLLIDAKNNIGNFLQTSPDNIIFTSGGTEAVNLAILGLTKNVNKKHFHIIASKIDHACVYNTLQFLEKKGFEISYIDINDYGAIKPEEIIKSIKKNTKLIVISAVNSETGVKIDLEKISKLAKENNIFLAVDGVALLGKEDFLIYPGISTMAFSAHKIHGPKGIGLCYVNPKITFSPILFGGTQENEKRAGTENLQGILGFSKAIDLLKSKKNQDISHMQKLKDHFENILIKKLDNIQINGKGPRICNTSNICFKGIDGESLLILLDQKGILASLGSACSSNSLKPSRILLNMGHSIQEAKASIRFSFSKYNTLKEIDNAAKIIIKLVNKLKK